MESLYVRKFSDELHKKARLRAVEENLTPREIVIKAAKVLTCPQFLYQFLS
jgi:hypothetical protein